MRMHMRMHIACIHAHTSMVESRLFRESDQTELGSSGFSGTPARQSPDAVYHL